MKSNTLIWLGIGIAAYLLLKPQAAAPTESAGTIASENPTIPEVEVGLRQNRKPAGFYGPGQLEDTEPQTFPFFATQ